MPFFFFNHSCSNNRIFLRSRERELGLRCYKQPSHEMGKQQEMGDEYILKSLGTHSCFVTCIPMRRWTLEIIYHNLYNMILMPPSPLCIAARSLDCEQ